MLTSPISMVSRSLGVSVFKSMTMQQRISRKLLVVNFIVLLVGSVALILFGRTIIHIVFTDKYLEALTVLPLLTAASFFNGMNQLYHSFFAAQKFGKYLRNTSIVSSSCNVIANVILISRLEMVGAAIASLVTYLLTYLMNLYYYRLALGSGKQTLSTAPRADGG
jgi:O-antigen/teichoic acid export membrane protein